MATTLLEADGAAGLDRNYIVGPHDKVLRANQSLLAFAPHEFKMVCCQTPSAPTLLPDEEPSVLENYFAFLSTWTVPRDSYTDLAYLYSFARRFDDRALADSIIGVFASAADRDGEASTGDPEVVNTVFEVTERDDPLRRLLADAFVVYQVLGGTTFDQYSSDFLDMVDVDRTLTTLGFDMIPEGIQAVWYQESTLEENTRAARLEKRLSRWDEVPACFTNDQAEQISRAWKGIRSSKNDGTRL